MRHSDQLIRRYLDGELTPAAAEDVRDHLASCPRCRNQLAAVQQLDARLRSLDQLTPPPDFAARVRAQVATLPPQRPASWLGPLALVSAILGLAGILWAAEQFFALASSILTVASDLQSRLLDLIGGEITLSGGELLVPAGAIEPSLVVGLCLLGIAGLLVLRQSIESRLET